MSYELRRARVWASVGYVLQGLFGSVVLTNLPGLQRRTGIGDTEVSLIMLVVLLVAAGGSLLAGWIAPRRGSAAVLVPAFVLQGAAVLLAILPLPFGWLFPVFAVFGLGIGLGDAGNGMQGLVIQRAYGRSIINAFFACTTGAAIFGALLVSGVAALNLRFEVGLAVAGIVGLTLVSGMRGKLAADPEATAAASGADAVAKVPIPRRGLLVFGLVVAAVFVGDGVVSAWSSVHLESTLFAAAWLVPLGYAAYQGCVLLARLTGDRFVMLLGRVPVVAVATVVAGVGLLGAAFAPLPWLAVVGFAVCGAGLGVLVPVSFTAASDLAPERTDEIVARLNIANYVGMLVGSAATGIVADALSLPIALAIPAVLVLASLAAVPAFRVRPRESVRPGV
ncbi:MAG: MFS transporter [Actinomycetes bacterium]